MEQIRAEQISKLPRRADGLFILSDGFRTACELYPLYAAYETEQNKKEGYPDILAQLQLLREELAEKDTLENEVLFLRTLLGTIDNISPQVYEYYHGLAELFCEVWRQMYARYRETGSFSPAQTDAGKTGTGKAGTEEAGTEEAFIGQLWQLVAHAADIPILLGEKYPPLGADGGQDVKSGSSCAGADRDAASADGQTEGKSRGIGLRLVWKTARAAALEIADGGKYFTRKPYRVCVNGQESLVTDKTITALYGLKPESGYEVTVFDGEGACGAVSFCTDYEFVTLDVRRFGAKGDGVQDDTPFLQAAILACPENSRVLIPAGVYRITALFLKSHVRIELGKGAELLAFTEKERFPVLPGMIESYDEKEQYNLGSWEGNPLPSYTGILCGLHAEDVVIYGEGTINGNASRADWWKDPKGYKEAFRPRLFFVNHCKNITLQGVTCKNSPAWTLHPYFSENLHFIGVTVLNPADSPNTDGCDPESCKNVEILGVRFSLGDDCIAVKSGKIYMGKTYRTPSENILIRQCLMENGHGAVTLGSEMAGGVINLTVEDCVFSHTDRGLRIKTRRGRGKDAVLDNIVFRNLKLDHVMTPLVVNAFYFCDPDGKTAYVQSREPYPVDDRTPAIRRLVFENMECTNCHVAAAFFDGLPEKKIEEIVMRNLSFRYAKEAKCDVPAMSEGVPRCSKKGLYARNVAKLVLEHVSIEGADGEAYELIGVDETDRRG